MERRAVVPLVSLQVYEVRVTYYKTAILQIYLSTTARSLPVAVASCAVIGGAMGTFDAAGSLAGDRRELDSPETMEERRKRFFKQNPSLSQTVES